MSTTSHLVSSRNTRPTSPRFGASSCTRRTNHSFGLLASLNLALDGAYTDPEINDVLTSVAALASLWSLCIKLVAFQRECFVDLRILAACPSLSDLELASKVGAPKFSQAQVDQIRTSLGHLQRLSVGWIKSDELARLLQPPVTARWQDIAQVQANARTGELLLRLPSLTKLGVRYAQPTVHVDFLSQLT